MRMSLPQVFIPLFTHFLPILYFFYMSLDLLIRDARKVEHRLVSLTSLCFMNLFLAELVRHQLPIEYSPVISAVWFSTSGILIPGLGFHFFIKVSKLDRRMPRYLYPYIFYTPIVFVVINVLRIDETIAVTQFHEAGIWKLPVYHTPYHITMAACVVNNLLYLIPLVIAIRQADNPELKGIYKLLAVGVVLSAAWFTVFGMIDFGEIMPPYPYLYGGLVWCYFMRVTMRKYDFLNFTDRRFERLFQLNPTAILLADMNGQIKEANPGAQQLFSSISVKPDNLWSIVDDNFRELVQRQQEIKDYEMSISGGDKTIDVLVDGGYVLVEARPHMIIIFRDVTERNESQKRIFHLAYHDPLTGLPNRRHFKEKLQERLEAPDTRDRQLAIVLVDADNFKNVNDQYGHQAGDEALMEIASLLREMAGADGMAARLGGDEFVVFLDGVPDVRYVEDWIKRLLDGFAQLRDDNRPFLRPVSLSIGVSLFPAHGRTIDQLLSQADKALYVVKREGKNHYRVQPSGIS